MNPYLQLAISMSVTHLNGSNTKLFLTRRNKNNSTLFLYQAVSLAVAALTLLIWNGGFSASLFTVLLGLAFGVLTATQTVFSMKAIQSGPWSYTSVITALSTIIPTLSGAMFWAEVIAPVQFVGIALMLICICLSSSSQKGGQKANWRWLIYCAITFFCTGFIGVLQKCHQNTQYKNELNEFLIIALGFSALFSLLLMTISLCKAKRAEKATAEAQDAQTTDPAPAQTLAAADDSQSDVTAAPVGATMKSMFAFVPILQMVIAGVTAAVNNKFNLYLSGVLDSSFLFPILNGGGLMLTTLAATLFFKERLSWKQWVGLGVGLIAVILLCNPF